MGLASSTSLQPSAPPISLSLAPYSTLLLDEAIRVGGGGTPTSLLEQVCEGSSRAPQLTITACVASNSSGCRKAATNAARGGGRVVRLWAGSQGALSKVTVWPWAVVTVEATASPH